MLTLVTERLNSLSFQRTSGTCEFFTLEAEAPPPLGMVVWLLGPGPPFPRTDVPLCEIKAQCHRLKNSSRKEKAIYLNNILCNM